MRRDGAHVAKARPRAAGMVTLANHYIPPPGRRFVNVSLFLGAGASVPYGKPTTEAFKDTLRQEAKHQDVWRAVLSSNLHKDIEGAFTAIEDLLELAERGGGVFYSDYNPRFKDEISMLKAKRKHLINTIYETYAWNYKYDDVLKNTLDPLIGLRKKPSTTVNIFTTNYDQSVERYCEIRGHEINLVDGFALKSKKYVWQGEFEPAKDFSSNTDQHADVFTVCLYKLHGSLMWRKNLVTKKIVKSEGEELPRDRNYTNLLIYPTKSPKISGDEPYKSTFEAFSAALKLSDVCVVVGFSFRDKDITDEFVKLLNAGRMLIVVDPRGSSIINENIPECAGLVVNDTTDVPIDPLSFNNDGTPRGKIVIIPDELGPDTAQKIADNIREHIRQ